MKDLGLYEDMVKLILVMAVVALFAAFMVYLFLVRKLNKLSALSKPDIPPVVHHPFKGGLLFESKIAVAEAGCSFIYPAGILTRRELASEVVATISGVDSSEVHTGSALPVGKSIGEKAVLNLRTADSTDDRRFMVLNVISVPLQSGTPVKVLMIGDSIVNRDGASLLDRYLRELGFNPQMVGLLQGMSSPGLSDGLLSEGRSGWESGDFTFAIDDRAIPIVDGEEELYLGLAKGARVTYNPFIRLARHDDPQDLIRNGYVFDCKFYQERFNLDTPDVVINALGTNDARDRPVSKIYDSIYDNDRIIHSQIRAAWPDAKIIRTLPSTAIASARNKMWTSKYAKIIRAMRASASDLRDPLLVVAPLWAMTNPECGYYAPDGIAKSDGFIMGNWIDPIHPCGASQHGFYKSMAPFVGAATLGLIDSYVSE